jgi:3-hydroxyacyl-[acyl-carrier-protein] dehydratase
MNEEQVMQSITVDIEEIMSIIPHRYPFLLIDKVVDLNTNESATGIKNVTINEPFFVGHFPKKPVMPGVLIIEALAQTACVLVAKSGHTSADSLVYFTSIEEAKFRQMVVPGDQLRLRVNIVKNRLKLWKMEGSAMIGDKVVAEAKFSAMVS